VLGFWWLHRHVLGPLDQLARFAREPSAAGGNGADRSLDRPDQIGGIARALQALHTDVQEWRHRVADLERSMDRHIEARTNEMTKALSHIARQVATDALTGLYNRRALEKRFTDLFDQYRQAGHDVSVVMIDIDNFKLLNDTCGHAAGDDVLRFTGELLKQSTREKDLAVRFGGDEFALILGGVNASGAVQIAARVVALFAQHAKLVAATPRPSLSAGVASMRVHCPDSAEHLLQMADAALYDAKGCGKGSVKTYDARSRVAAPVGVL
jgi:diguanylate cyclase (GGDEF)-like protein